MKTLSYDTIKEKPFLSRKETAFYLGLHVNTLDKTSIPFSKIGKRKVYSRQAVDSWILEHSEGASREE